MNGPYNANLLAYDGDEPYIFVSYAHKDAKTVLPIVEAMQKRGFRIWFDLGIQAGTEWANNIAAHLRDCAAFVAFVSGNSAQSENCLDEIAFAKSHRKPSLLVFMEENATLPEGTEMQTARFQRMFYFRHNSMESFVQKLSEAAVLAACRDGATVCETFYESPTPTRKASPLLIAGIAAVTVLLAVLLITLLSRKSDDREPLPSESQTMQATTVGTEADPPTAQTTQAEEPQTTTLTEAQTTQAEEDQTSAPEETEAIPQLSEVSENLYDFTFKLDGAVMQLPCSLSDFENNGWTISSSVSSQTLIYGLSSQEFNMSKDGKRITLEAFNFSGNAMPISGCTVCEIHVYGAETPYFEISGGVHPGDSQAAITDALGVPTDRTDYNSGEILLTYQEGSDSKIQTKLYCHSSNISFSYINLKNYVDLNNTVTETDATVPEYLKDYQAPTKLGDDPLSGVIQLNGDLYMIPAPLQAFLDNGWVLTKSPTGIPSMGSQSIRISRDEVNLNLKIGNGALYQTTAENCVVISIEAEHSSKSKYPELILPKGIKLGMTCKEVEALVPSSVKKDDYSSYSSFWYSEYNPRNFTLFLTVNKNPDLLRKIRVDCTTWPYTEG